MNRRDVAFIGLRLIGVWYLLGGATRVLWHLALVVDMGVGDRIPLELSWIINAVVGLSAPLVELLLGGVLFFLAAPISNHVAGETQTYAAPAARDEMRLHAGPIARLLVGVGLTLIGARSLLGSIDALIESYAHSVRSFSNSPVNVVGLPAAIGIGLSVALIVGGIWMMYRARQDEVATVRPGREMDRRGDAE